MSELVGRISEAWTDEARAAAKIARERDHLLFRVHLQRRFDDHVSKVVYVAAKNKSSLSFTSGSWKPRGMDIVKTEVIPLDRVS